MIRFIENIVYLALLATLFGFGAIVFYFRTHGIDNQCTLAMACMGWAAVPVRLFYEWRQK